MHSEPGSLHPQPLSAKLVLGVAGVVMTLVAGVVAISMGGGPAGATIAFKNDTGQPCSFCHATPGTDMSILSIEGQRFRNNGYKLQGPAPFHPPAAGAPSTAARPMAQCKSEGSPCASAGQCCSGACIKGFAEGQPGAWCGADGGAARPATGGSGDFADMSCRELWHARNAIFAEFGHCFESKRGIDAFGRGCFAPFGKLSANAQARVNTIISWERRRGCSG